MNKEDIINYVMTTPGNPNRAVLNGMLDSIAEAGGEPLLVIKGEYVSSSESYIAGTVIEANMTPSEVAELIESGKNPQIRLEITQKHSTSQSDEPYIFGTGNYSYLPKRKWTTFYVQGESYDICFMILPSGDSWSIAYLQSSSN